MRFVDEHQGIGRQIVNQGRGRITRVASRKMARIVFDAFAKSEFTEHFHVESGSLLDALRLNQPALFLEECDLRNQFLFDGVYCPQHCRSRRDVMARRINRESRQLLDDLSG